MIFPSSFIELPIVDTHSPTGDSPLRNEFIFSLRIVVILPFFSTTSTGLTHSLSEMG
jgi:hypothetical protein